ncbi:MAG: AsmA family protein, partial [Saprospiraceae bacterium]
MKRGIKIALITVAVVFALILVAALTVPYLFKDQILAAVKDAANKSLNAKMDFSDVNLSLFRDFPDVSVRLENLSIRNIEPFEDIHLADVEAADLTVDIMSIIRNQKPWRIKYIGVKQPRINVFVLEDGRANYDIAKPSVDTVSGAADEASGSFNIALDEYNIEDANILYDDESQGVVLNIKGLNHRGSGDFTETIYDLDTDTDIDSLSLSYGGIPYLKKAHTTLDAIFNIDQSQSKYTLKDNTLKINELTVKADGFVQMPDTSNIVMDLKFSTPENSFKNLLSMIPNAYIAGYENVKAEGTFEFGGFVKGTYNAENETYPAFAFNLGVNNGNIKYPDLPLGISNINTKVNVNSPTSNFDDLVVDVPTFAMKLGSNPIRAIFNLKTPISDPDVNTQIDGTLNLKELSQAFPMEGVNALTGIITADVDVKTRLSTIEAQRYDEVNMRGTMGIRDFNYKDAAYPAIKINNAQAAFTPENVKIQNFDAKLGKSDIKASGSIQNILAYFSPKKTMRGSFTVRSNRFDVNEWMPQETTTAATPALPAAETIPATAQPTEIFDRFDMTVDAQIGEMNYDIYKLKNMVVRGNMKPNKLVAQEFSTVIGDSDVKASGTITNLFDYLFDNQTLGGNIAVRSKLMNLNQFMTEDGSVPPAPATTTEANTAATANMEPFLVPENIDMSIQANIDKLVYTNLVIDHLVGTL